MHIYVKLDRTAIPEAVEFPSTSRDVLNLTPLRRVRSLFDPKR